MALKPLRKLADRSVIVQFHWLKQHKVQAAKIFGDADINVDNYVPTLGLEGRAARFA